jgi:hypothetical protein
MQLSPGPLKRSVRSLLGNRANEMILLKLITTSLLVAAFGLAAKVDGDALPDFTGTWKVDRNLSSPRVVRDLEDLTLVVSQISLQLHVKRVIKEKKHKERVSEVTYYTDGRGEVISFLFGNEKVKSKTNWVDGTLVSRYRVSGFINSDVYYRDYTETWTLSDDGKTLTINTEIKVGNVVRVIS